MGQFFGKPLNKRMFLGELSLDGTVRSVRGALSATLAARGGGLKAIAVPHSNAREAAVVEGIDVFAVKSLPETVDLVNSPESFAPVKVDAHLSPMSCAQTASILCLEHLRICVLYTPLRTAVGTMFARPNSWSHALPLRILKSFSSEIRTVNEISGSREKIPRDGADSIRNTQAVCDFRCWASKHTPLVHTINAMVAIVLAKVRRAISGLMPLVSKAV
jgi:hypothetical protein